MRLGGLRSLVCAAATLTTTVLAACGGVPDARAPATTSPVPTAAATTAPSPSTSTTTDPGAAAAAWTRASAPALEVGGGATSTLAAVLAPSQVGRSWLVAGTRTAADGSAQATVWTSPDATSWTPTGLTNPGVNSAAAAATTFGSRTVVVGSTGSGASRRAAVWVSPSPGAAFASVPYQRAFAAPAPAPAPAPDSGDGGEAGGAEMHVVAAGALGLFAAGTVSGQQAMWYSTDGRHFTRLAGAEQVVDAALRADVRAILVTPTGVFAAGEKAEGARRDGALWTSTDGIHWSQEPDPQQSFSSNGDHVITGLVTINRSPGVTYVAVGAVDSAGVWSPASWISPDGYSWSAPSLSFPLSSSPRPQPDGTVIHTVAAGPAGLVAVGGGGDVARAWTSGDGQSWAPLALPPVAAAAAWDSGLVATDGSTTLVGDRDPGSPRLLATSAGAWRELSADAATWGPPRPEATPASLLTVGQSLDLIVDVTVPGQLLGQDHTSVVVLTSTDGSQWAPTASGGVFADTVVTDAVAAPPSGLVAVGAQAATTGRVATAQPQAAAWQSPDAAHWLATDATAAGFGSGITPTSATGITRLASGGLVAVGTGAPGAAGADSGGGTQPVAWVSSGGSWKSTGTLDRPSALLDGTVGGVCTGPSGAVAVGDAAFGVPGRTALAWTSADGGTWRRATIPPTVPGGTAIIAGCTPTGATGATGPSGSAGPGLVAWGATTGPDGAEVPAVWQSEVGATWTLRKEAAFIVAAPAPLSSVAVSGRDWLAVGGGRTPAADTRPGGGLGLWRSGDAGDTWTRVDTSGTAWQAVTGASVDRVAWLHETGVVAGTVDGQLAVWVSTPAT